MSDRTKAKHMATMLSYLIASHNIGLPIPLESIHELEYELIQLESELVIL